MSLVEHLNSNVFKPTVVEEGRPVQVEEHDNARGDGSVVSTSSGAAPKSRMLTCESWALGMMGGAA
jgi:hypothetical protein